MSEILIDPFKVLNIRKHKSCCIVHFAQLLHIIAFIINSGYRVYINLLLMNPYR